MQLFLHGGVLFFAMVGWWWGLLFSRAALRDPNPDEMSESWIVMRIFPREDHHPTFNDYMYNVM